MVHIPGSVVVRAEGVGVAGSSRSRIHRGYFVRRRGEGRKEVIWGGRGRRKRRTSVAIVVVRD